MEPVNPHVSPAAKALLENFYQLSKDVQTQVISALASALPRICAPGEAPQPQPIVCRNCGRRLQ